MERLSTLMSQAYISRLETAPNIRDEIEKIKRTAGPDVLELVEKEIYSLSPKISSLNLFNVFNATGVRLNLTFPYIYKPKYTISPNGKYFLAYGSQTNVT